MSGKTSGRLANEQDGRQAGTPFAADTRPMLFAPRSSSEMGTAIARALGAALAAHEERDFEDGEHKIRPLDTVQNRDVYIVQSLYGDMNESVHDKLCKLLFLAGAVRDAGAARLSAVIPYLCYARKDRRTKPNDPVTMRYVAQMLEIASFDAVVALEVHNPAAFENAFRRRTVTLTAAPLFVAFARSLASRKLAVVSPDPGGAKRADLLREALEVALQRPLAKGYADKRRSAGVVTGDLFVGDVEGCCVLLIDDLISTGNTLVRAARAARAAGASEVIGLVTHGLFMQGATDAIADPAIDRLVVTDSISTFRLGDHACRRKIEVLPAAPLLAGAIARLHRGEPLTDLLVC